MQMLYSSQAKSVAGFLGTLSMVLLATCVSPKITGEGSDAPTKVWQHDFLLIHLFAGVWTIKKEIH